MSSGNRGNWGNRKPWGGRGRGGFGGRDRGSRGGVNKNYRGHSFGNNRGFRGGRQNDYGGRGPPQPFQNYSQSPRDTPGKRLSEEEIGVTEYINDHEGFLGVIKSRYSDFQVSEINLNGEIAKLTNTKPPQPPVDKDVEQDEDLLLNKYNVEILPMDEWDRINKLAVSEASSEKVEIDVTGMSKEERTKIHDAVKKAFGDSIVGSTVGDGDKKLVRFERYRKGVRIDNRVKWVWGGEHVHFILHKENCDTMDAAQRLAERLRMNLRPSSLGYAGTKDRRAKTSQWFSARKLDPRRLAGAARDLRDIHIGNYTFHDTHLKLGMLKGNRFRIALRNVTAPEDSVEKACQLLNENGFINYYGLQRFGTRADTPTYEIGKSMLKGEFQEAINGILRPRPGPLQFALEQYRDHGAGAALAAGIRAHNTIELKLLKALASQPKDLLGALNKLARNTRLLYIHSYQSMVWNRAVSERIKRFGLKPAAGDLVPLSEVDDDIDEDIDEENPDEQDGAETQDGVQDGGDAQNGGQTESTEEKPENQTGMQKEPVKFPVKVLTQEDVDSGQFSILDIIMPLPGYFIDYPPNMVDFYEELLKKDGLTMELKNKIKSLSMSGAYRRLVTRPIDMTWSFVRYNSPTEDLILSDMDEIRGVTLKETPDGKYKALLLSMSLPASCYATMALRELLKVDTSGDNQALQNNYHKKTEPTETSDKGKEASEDKAEDTSASKNGSGGDKDATKRKLDADDSDAKRAKQGGE
ncbi:pseudouridylate synthase 7 homolog [Leguminivora glycinivorella]|uniref:pseudouridylate synthase 7 homolog n=1 Tax=Leguminivora glycinivorella TaxID=1035111 RepID=UPI00200E735C|nr:pseudouridylate synthase 7 homolog [Leguminivora glycinivorella]